VTLKYDTAYLEKCRQLIAQKLSWQGVEEWRNYEFTELSEKIFDATNVQLSTTTLKRIFGKIKYESLPSTATLNTLAQYLGYESWMQFKASQASQNETQVEKTNEQVAEKAKYHFSRKALVASAAFVVLIVLFGFVFLNKKQSYTENEFAGVEFKSKPLAEGLPNSVVFNMDLKEIKSDDIRIQQSWDSTKTIYLKPGQTEATGIYYDPGYFRAKLIVDGKIIKEHDLFIKSDGWVATIDHEPVPVYLKKEELVFNNKMTVSSSVLDQLKNEDKPVTLTYHLVQPFDNLDANNYIFETSFQNIYSDGPAVCKTAKLFILCTNGAFIIPFSIPGCVSDINLKLLDNTFYGKENDLSIFGTDPSQKINLRMEVKDRSVKIFNDGKLLKESSFIKDAGQIVGLRYSFLGAGSVDAIKIQNKDGKIVFAEKFIKAIN
jgi:hypothetical protein